MNLYPEIIEQYIQGKRKDQSLNEDGLVITENYIAVIDGASSAAPFNGVSGGLLAKNILVKGLSEMKTEDDGFEVIKRLDSLLHEAQKDFPESKLDPAKRMYASLVIYSVKDRQIWNYGDCPFLINGTFHQFDKKIDTLNADVRSFITQAELSLGKREEDILRNDVGATFIKTLLNYQPVFANKSCEFGYPILDGYGINKDLFECIDVSDGDEVVLATDGYPKLCGTLEESERELSRILAEDPLCIMNENRAVKGVYDGLDSFDDRCYIRFTV